MPAVNEEVPVKVAVNVHKDGKPVAVQAQASQPKAVGPNMFSALANNRRIVPEPPPPPTQLFNPPPRGGNSDDDSSYLGDEEEYSDEEGMSDDSRGFRGLEENAERTKAMKSECLQKLHRYAQQGFPVPEHLGMRSSLEELQGECDRIKRGIDTQNSIQFQRRMLVTFVTGCEYLNGAYDPVGVMGGPSLQLQGWSKNVMSEIDSFDAVFEQLYDKYRNRAPMPPELQLFMALAMSAVVCHMQNSNGSVAKPPPAEVRRAPPAPPPAPSQTQAPQQPATEPRRAQPAPPPPPPPPSNETLTRSAPDPAPYIMQAPPSLPGLGIFPALNPVGMGAQGPALVSIDVPPASAADLLNPPAVEVPPRDVPGTITELPPSPAPSAKARKKPPSRKKKADAPSEAGVEL